MKKNLLKIILVGLAAFLLIGCSEEDYYDNTPPSPPTNVKTYLGDNEVELSWSQNPESDVAGYNVYFAYDYWGKYELIGSTPSTYFVDNEAQNGDLYYYGVAAYDYDGNESELSYDEVYGVARPQGMNQSIFEMNNFPNSSGYDFSEFSVLPYNEDSDIGTTDFFYEIYEGTPYLTVWLDTEIQDMGETMDIYDITKAPVGGWVSAAQGENIKYVKVIPGHTYVILTWDDHYAKVRVGERTSERLIFDWAYQLLEGERMLKSNTRNSDRQPIPSERIRFN